MDPRLQQVPSSGAPSQDTAMHMPAGPVSSHLGIRTQSYFCFTTATLALCLIFAVATIMVLEVQRADSVPNPVVKPIVGGKYSEDILRILKTIPFKKSWAYLQVSKHLNQSILSWNSDGIIDGIKYEQGHLVIQSPGLYFIICQLQFLVTRCPKTSLDLKLELLINEVPKKQALVTVCKTGVESTEIYQNLSQFLLEHLQVNSTISVRVEKFEFVDTNTFPLDNVLSIFLYNNSD
ncbi:PREDICTED: tumor necrosis factor ligand superfamily member 8 [Elephantulus edwardii]|uniref:tumor necrosis factor ligand superfamily member 8 n=1 Tax=Elephantulus edwardii TaxID=28737 RepID=UPI0003F0CC54|nr:PREDICTED: tumor necrosis factor ligand superfamily member 8 [Elephantulus edwardii]